MVGYWLAQVPLTAVPQRTALSHAFGGLAAGLVGTAKYFYWYAETDSPNLTTFRMCAIIAEIILGYLTFTGSLIAAAQVAGVQVDSAAAVGVSRPDLRQSRERLPWPCCWDSW